MRAATLVIVAVIQAVTFTSVARGTNSQINQPRQVVVRTTAEWQALWKEHAATPAPAVDFSKSIVVGVFAGSRPTAGYAVQITAVRRSGTDAIVEYVERTPNPSGMMAQVITSPFDLAAVPRDLQKVEFKRTPR